MKKYIMLLILVIFFLYIAFTDTDATGFDEIKPGMTIQEVEVMLGKPYTTTITPEYSLIYYTYRAGGKNMFTVTFKNETVTNTFWLNRTD